MSAPPAKDTLDAEDEAENEVLALCEQVIHHHKLLEPEFMKMMQMLTLSQPTEWELTDAEIVGVNFLVSALIVIWLPVITRLLYDVIHIHSLSILSTPAR
ncbi:hypothetical protein OPQ81_002225 [Rhizoctonia solani]|nr:hypothetical protein OPQ81_002225 [Rhizoctonia solani]